VVCKLLIAYLLILLIFQFYINYVVCILKGYKKNHSEKGGFILTMWYVNHEKIRRGGGLFKSFILTMWYVNLKLELFQKAKHQGFILTMWYVNFNCPS
ncbi:hypothetical protein LWE86_18480, partial [Clostridioides difficile]